MAARDAALKDASSVRGHCKTLEGELQGLRDELAKEVRGRQAKEEEMKAREAAVKDRDAELSAYRGRLKMLEQTLEGERVELDAKAKVLAEDRAAFMDYEVRSRKALKTLYEEGLEKPLAGATEGPAKLLPFLAEELEEVVTGIGPMAEVEARVLSSAALTRILSHVYLRNPDANLDDLLEPLDVQCSAAAAEAVKGRAEALLEKFRAFNTVPKRGAAGTAASGGGADKRNSTTSGGGAQG